MIKTRHKRFSGGYSFKYFQGQPKETLIEFEIPSTVSILLEKGITASVKTGDSVKAGQIIARDDNLIGSPVHSSVSGTVDEIKEISCWNGKVQAVVVSSDGKKEWEALEGHSENWLEISPSKTEELIYLSGTASLDRCGIPTRFKSSVIDSGEVNDIIIHASGSDVYNLSTGILFKDTEISDFADGLKILKKIMPKANIHLALHRNLKPLLNDLSALLEGEDGISFYTLESKYPQGFDEILIPTVLKKKFPPGFTAANIGVAVLSLQTVIHAYEAVTSGKPVIERIIGLAGPGFKEPVHAKVRTGTPVEKIIEGRLAEGEMRIVRNSTMTGEIVSDLSNPVDRTFSHVLAFPEVREGEMFEFGLPGFNKDSYSNTIMGSLLGLSKKADTYLGGEPRPCIFCGFCQEVCPVGIIPHHISRFVQRDLVDESLPNLGIFKCIECNLCSYVCPSKVKLSAHMKEGKKMLREIGCDHTGCISSAFTLKGLETSDSKEES